MSVETAVGTIPEHIDSTPVYIEKTGPRLPCPHDECGFQYWNTGNRQGKRTPTTQDKFSARSEPCDHFHAKWSPKISSSLTSTLTDAAESATEITCVMDKQVTLEENAQTVAVYVNQQATFGDF